METFLISNDWFLKLALDFLMATGLAFIIVPSIRAVSRRWSLYDFDVSQQVTLSHIPRHGGIAMVVAFGITIAVFSAERMVPGVKFILAALLLLLAAGLQDDLLHLSWFLRIMVVVGSAAIITDVAGMPLFRTGLGVIFDYPLPDLLVTYGIYTGCVVLLIGSSRIPGMVSLILILVSVAMTVIFLRSGFPELAILPVSLAGASVTLFITALGNYVYEGRTTALAGGFLLAMMIIYTHNISSDLIVDYPSLFTVIVALVFLPVMILTRFFKWENNRFMVFGKQIKLVAFQLVVLFVLTTIMILF